jgi:hypothetical protein
MGARGQYGLGHLVVDENNVCHGLLDSIKGSSWLGGEYKKYGSFTKKLFQGLKRYFREVIIIFDSSQPELKMDKRARGGTLLLMLTLISVFLDVLTQKLSLLTVKQQLPIIGVRHWHPILTTSCLGWSMGSFNCMDDWLRMDDKSWIFTLSMAKRI